MTNGNAIAAGVLVIFEGDRVFAASFCRLHKSHGSGSYGSCKHKHEHDLFWCVLRRPRDETDSTITVRAIVLGAIL